MDKRFSPLTELIHLQGTKAVITLSEPQHHVAQNHALDTYSKELERVVASSKFLSQCHTQKIIRQSDKENITKHRNPSEKVKIFTNRIKDLPRLFTTLITVLKKDPKNRLLATSIEEAKASKEHEMKLQQEKIKAHKSLAFEVGKRFSTIVTGVESELCLENQPLDNIVKELSKLVDQVEIFKRKFNPDHKATIFSLIQIEENRKHGENLKTLELQLENDRLQREIESLKRDMMRTQDVIERHKNEVLNRENWIKGLETNLDNINKKNLEYEKKLKWCQCSNPAAKIGHSEKSDNDSPKGRMSTNSNRRLYLVQKDFEIINDQYDDQQAEDENNNTAFDEFNEEEIFVPEEEDFSEDTNEDTFCNELSNINYGEEGSSSDDTPINSEDELEVKPTMPKAPILVITQHWSRHDSRLSSARSDNTQNSEDTSIGESESIDVTTHENSDSDGYSSATSTDSSDQTNMTISKVIIKKYKRSVNNYYKE